jgi:hypothetical protein
MNKNAEKNEKIDFTQVYLLRIVLYFSYVTILLVSAYRFYRSFFGSWVPSDAIFESDALSKITLFFNIAVLIYLFFEFIDSIKIKKTLRIVANGFAFIVSTLFMTGLLNYFGLFGFVLYFGLYITPFFIFPQSISPNTKS